LLPLLKPSTHLPINRKKWLDIQKQLPYIPEVHQGFLRNLTAADDVLTAQNEEESESQEIPTRGLIT